jgi:hypothetical protein
MGWGMSPAASEPFTKWMLLRATGSGAGCPLAGKNDIVDKMRHSIVNGCVREGDMGTYRVHRRYSIHGRKLCRIYVEPSPSELAPIVR